MEQLPMISKVEIQNFQAHKKSSIAFGPGVNVIRGSSDNGKSSLIRAIYWALFNRPSGTGFLTWGAAASTFARLHFDNGAIVLREKDKKTNFYMRRINGGDTNQDKFQALRTDVPTEISDTHQLEAFNVQRQHDRYFLLQDSPGEVGRQLNEVMNLSVIGATLAAATRYVGGKKATVGQLIAEKQSLENQFHALPPIETLLPHIEKCNEQAKLLIEFQQVSTQVAAVYGEYAAAHARFAAIPDVGELVPTVQEVVAALGVHHEQSRAIANLTTLLARYNKAMVVLRQLPNIDGLYKTINATKNMFDQAAKNRNDRQRIWEVYQQYRTSQIGCAQLAAKIAAAESTVCAFKEQNPLCPLCNQSWGNA